MTFTKLCSSSKVNNLWETTQCIPINSVTANSENLRKLANGLRPSILKLCKLFSRILRYMDIFQFSHITHNKPLNIPYLPYILISDRFNTDLIEKGVLSAI